MNSTLAAAGYQTALVQTSVTVFSAVATNNSLAGMSVQKNNGSHKHIATPIENIGARVLKPAIDSLSYWAGRSVELWKNFLSFPGASATQVGYNQTQTNHSQAVIASPTLSRIAALYELFKEPSRGANERSTKDRLSVQAEALLGLAKKEGLVDTKVGALANEVGNFFRLTGDFTKARAYYEQGLEVYATFYGTENTLSVAATYNNLANVLKSQGNLAETKRCYEMALSIFLTKHKTEYRADVGMIYNNLGALFQTQGDIPTGRMYAEKAVKVQSEVHKGEDHLDLAMAYNTLGNAQRLQGDLADAKQNYLEALLILTHLHEAESRTETGVIYNNLGLVLRSEGNLADAKAYFQAALKIKIECHGSEVHTEVAITYHSLAMVLEDEGLFDEAEEALRNALRIFTTCYGTEKHPNIAINLNNLGLVLSSKKDFIGAQDCFERVIAIKQELERNPLELAGSYKNLANLLKHRGDFVKAKESFKKALEFYIAAHKTETHADVVAGYMNVGNTCFALKQFEEAKVAYRKGREIAQKVFGNQYNALFDERIKKCGK